MLIPLDCLKIGDKFLDLRTDNIYSVVSEPVDGEILCACEEGFDEMFDKMRIVRPISR